MKKTVIPRALFALIIVFIVLIQQNGKNSNISVQDVYAMIQQDSTTVLLDVRTIEEYGSESGHMKNALLIPVQELEQRIAELEHVKDKTIIVYCRSGHRSAQAVEILRAHGYSALSMDGGMKKWNIEKLPAVIERQ